jgi:hypothetical protein
MGETRGSYRFWVGTHEGEGPRVRPRRRWSIIIKWNLRAFRRTWTGVGAAQDRESVWRDVVNTVKILRVPSHAGNFLTNCGTISFSRRAAPRGKLIGR